MSEMVHTDGLAVSLNGVSIAVSGHGAMGLPRSLDLMGRSGLTELREVDPALTEIVGLGACASGGRARQPRSALKTRYARVSRQIGVRGSDAEPQRNSLMR